MQDIKERVEWKNLVTTLTKKMAEELTSTILIMVYVKSKYMHSEISAIERVEIIKALKNGEFDVLVGING